ncbi:MAG: substrate-binding domain-containing protein [Rhodocyclales bacterium]|nr:substrate-binding domain-containing protein [Rhodocyclales bacterium]
MAHRIFRWLGLLVLSVLTSLAAAAEQAPPGNRGMLRLTASATLAPLAAEVVETVQRKGGRIALNVVGSEVALEQLSAGQADAALISRSLSEGESRLLDGRIVGHDSLLLVVHERNPLTQIDDAGVRAIFSRQVSDWSQIGAGNGGAIVPVTRGLGNGTRTVVDTAFGIGRVVPAGIVELGTNLAVVLYVAADPQAIGYVSSGAYERARQRGVGIKAVRLGGFTPSAQFCVGSHYPLCRPLLLVKRRHAPATRELMLLEATLGGPLGEDLFVRHGFAAPAVAP